MRKITEILRLKHEAKLSHEKIALALGVSKGVVSKYSGHRGQVLPFAFSPPVLVFDHGTPPQD